MIVTAAPPSRPTAERLVGDLSYLSPAPRVLPRLQRLLADANSSLYSIVELVRLDSALTARMIRMSNSAWFGRGAGCQTLEDAVNRVGFREVSRLVATAAAASIVQPLNLYGMDATAAWRETVACAFAAEMLATRTGQDMAASYTLGLLHTVGRTAINHYAAAARKVGRLANAGFPAEHSAAEVAWLGYHQATVAAHMLRKWEFTPVMIEPIRWQYDPLQAPVPYDVLAAILYAARFLRSTICATNPEESLRADPAILGRLRMTENELLGLIGPLREQLFKASQLTDLGGGDPH